MGDVNVIGPLCPRLKAIRILVLVFLLQVPFASFSQSQLDSSLNTLKELPLNYFQKVSSKVEIYQARLTKKTKQTLEKLVRWEEKIRKLLTKVSPQTAQQLFGENKITFKSLLEQFNKGVKIAGTYKAQVDQYREKVTNSIYFIDQQKKQVDEELLKPVSDTKSKLEKLDNELSNYENLNQAIRERKKQLVQSAIKVIGKSKQLQKINKEVYYYAQALFNYKEIFNDPLKVEQLALKLLEKIPGFQEFLQSNRMSGPPINFSNATAANLAALGYQSNALVARQIQQSGVGNFSTIRNLTQGNAASFNSPLQELKNRFPHLNSTDDIPDFKPNEMKGKTLGQRLQLGVNLQFGRPKSLLPGTADLGFQIAYKLNKRSSTGIGTSYKLGLGSGLSNIRFTSEGVGLRSFIDWKLKGSFFVNGGFEYNYQSSFSSIRSLPAFSNSHISNWKPAALIGISKKQNIGKTKSSLMLLYDFLGSSRIPQTQSFIVRFGYTFQ